MLIFNRPQLQHYCECDIVFVQQIYKNKFTLVTFNICIFFNGQLVCAFLCKQKLFKMKPCNM